MKGSRDVVCSETHTFLWRQHLCLFVAELRAVEGGTEQTGAVQDCVAQDRPVQHRLGKVCASEKGAFQVDALQVQTSQIGAVELRAPESNAWFRPAYEI
jgi:hypothetical protein